MSGGRYCWRSGGARYGERVNVFTSVAKFESDIFTIVLTIIDISASKVICYPTPREGNPRGELDEQCKSSRWLKPHIVRQIKVKKLGYNSREQAGAQ